jgi:hypothetical protein
MLKIEIEQSRFTLNFYQRKRIVTKRNDKIKARFINVSALLFYNNIKQKKQNVFGILSK